MDLRLIKKLISLLEDSQLAELSLEKEGFAISLKKHPVNMTYQSIPTTSLVTTPAEKAHTMTQASGTEVSAPMVGTFYHASAPDKPPYIKVGDRIAAGSTIGIIEAMKMMNAIPSPISGVVEKICVPNASGVEFGQALIIVKQD